MSQVPWATTTTNSCELPDDNQTMNTPENETGSSLDIRYRFHCANGTERRFDLHLDPLTLKQSTVLPEQWLPWTQLEFHQCSNCPLQAETHSHCPVATSLQLLEAGFTGLWSYDELFMEVTTAERTISATTTAQRGASSLLGLMMATSGCPHTAWFRPMARFHLPLANEQDTIYRGTSMYLLAQYFRAKAGQQTGFDLTGLTEIYRQLRIVNASLAERLRATSDKDTSVNAVILLDLLAKTLPQCIDDDLSELRYLFAPYI